MKLRKMLDENRFSLVISLPDNSLTLAQAALEGGAQAVKVHCNVLHHASGRSFGTFSENKAFLKELIRLCGDVPVGLVPGADKAFVSAGEKLEMEEMGVDFISSYANHLPCYMMEPGSMDMMISIDSTYTQSTLDGVNLSRIDILECGIQPADSYGRMLDYSDVMRYADIAAKVKVPTLIPTQKNITPRDVRHLKQAGCKALMIGAIVLGKEPSAHSVRETVGAFRAASDARD